jgi:predicted esterase
VIVNVNDTALFYEKSGAGPPMILLHGNGEDHHIFDKLSAKLENDFTLYSVDSRITAKAKKQEIIHTTQWPRIFTGSSEC